MRRSISGSFRTRSIRHNATGGDSGASTPTRGSGCRTVRRFAGPSSVPASPRYLQIRAVPAMVIPSPTRTRDVTAAVTGRAGTAAPRAMLATTAAMTNTVAVTTAAGDRRQPRRPRPRQPRRPRPRREVRRRSCQGDRRHSGRASSRSAHSERHRHRSTNSFVAEQATPRSARRGARRDPALRPPPTAGGGSGGAAQPAFVAPTVTFGNGRAPGVLGGADQPTIAAEPIPSPDRPPHRAASGRSVVACPRGATVD